MNCVDNYNLDCGWCGRLCRREGLAAGLTGAAGGLAAGLTGAAGGLAAGLTGAAGGRPIP